jgi:hypothetical protein
MARSVNLCRGRLLEGRIRKRDVGTVADRASAPVNNYNDCASANNHSRVGPVGSCVYRLNLRRYRQAQTAP